MPDTTPPPKPPPTWSEQTRTWVSLVLFAHLFILLVAVTSYTRPSDLQMRLHDLFAPYLRNLHLTALPVSYPFARFHLGHGGPSDIDFRVEVSTAGAEGSETFELPGGPLRPGIRQRRFQALANATGTLASGELGDVAVSILPKTIAAYALREHNAKSGEIRVQGLGLPRLDEVAGLADVDRAARANVDDIYEANVILGPVGVELLRKSTTLEVAPVENGAAAPNSRPRAGSGGDR